MAKCHRLFSGLVSGEARDVFTVITASSDDEAVAKAKAEAAANEAFDCAKALYNASKRRIERALAVYARVWMARVKRANEQGAASAAPQLGVAPSDLQKIAKELFAKTRSAPEEASIAAGAAAGPSPAPEAAARRETQLVPVPQPVDRDLSSEIAEDERGLLRKATYPFLALRPRYMHGADIFDPSKDVRLSAYFGVDIVPLDCLRSRIVSGLARLLARPAGGSPSGHENEPLRVFVGRSLNHIPLRYAVTEDHITEILVAACDASECLEAIMARSACDASERERVLEDTRKALVRQCRSDQKYVFPYPDLIDIDDQFVDGSFRVRRLDPTRFRFLPTAVHSEIGAIHARFADWRRHLQDLDDEEEDVEQPCAREIQKPLLPFSAKRIDYSLHRLEHYTGVPADQIQPYIFFTNYPFYIRAFLEECYNKYVKMGQGTLIVPVKSQNGKIWTEIGKDLPHQFRSASGDIDAEKIIKAFEVKQMPAIHFIAGAEAEIPGVTMVNIGVGPSNAKTMTDLMAAMAPKAWLMLGHCGGLRVTQELGQFVLAQAYVRDDNVLNATLPPYVPIPQLLEVQECLMRGIEDVLLEEDSRKPNSRFSLYKRYHDSMLELLSAFGAEIPDPTRLKFNPEHVVGSDRLKGVDALKQAALFSESAAESVADGDAGHVVKNREAVAQAYKEWRREVRLRVRTGTVLSTDDRNWELRLYDEMIERFERSRTIAVDMESATIAGNGLRYRIPYGTLLCVSDKPLMGEPKMRGPADEFYQTSTRNHVRIGLRAIRYLARRGDELSQSRKLNGLDDPPIL